MSFCFCTQSQIDGLHAFLCCALDNSALAELQCGEFNHSIELSRLRHDGHVVHSKLFQQALKAGCVEGRNRLTHARPFQSKIICNAPAVIVALSTDLGLCSQQHSFCGCRVKIPNQGACTSCVSCQVQLWFIFHVFCGSFSMFQLSRSTVVPASTYPNDVQLCDLLFPMTIPG